MLIRTANAGDLKEVFEIYMEGYGEKDFTDINRLKKPSPKTMPLWRKRILGDIKNGHLVFLVAVDRGKVIGFAFAKKKDIPDSEMSHIGIVGMRVASRMRGRGIGQRLLGEAIKRSRGRFEMLELAVMSTNKAGIHIYEKYGFKEWGTLPNAVKRGRSYIDMKHMFMQLK